MLSDAQKYFFLRKLNYGSWQSSFLFDYSAWSLSHFLNLGLDVFHWFEKYLAIISLNNICIPLSCLFLLRFFFYSILDYFYFISLTLCFVFPLLFILFCFEHLFPLHISVYQFSLQLCLIYYEVLPLRF